MNKQGYFLLALFAVSLFLSIFTQWALILVVISAAVMVFYGITDEAKK